MNPIDTETFMENVNLNLKYFKSPGFPPELFDHMRSLVHTLLVMHQENIIIMYSEKDQLEAGNNLGMLGCHCLGVGNPVFWIKRLQEWESENIPELEFEAADKYVMKLLEFMHLRGEHIFSRNNFYEYGRRVQESELLVHTLSCFFVDIQTDIKAKRELSERDALRAERDALRAERDALRVQREMLAEKVEALQAIRQCVVCHDSPVTIAAVPCGHRCFCTNAGCYTRVGRCPLCRTPMTGTLRIF